MGAKGWRRMGKAYPARGYWQDGIALYRVIPRTSLLWRVGDLTSGLRA